MEDHEETEAYKDFKARMENMCMSEQITKWCIRCKYLNSEHGIKN